MKPYRRATLLAIGIAAVLALGWSLIPGRTAIQPRSLQAVAELVDQTGKPETLPANAAKFFKLGDTDLEFREVRMKAPSGSRRACQIRRNSSGGLDVFLILAPAGEQGAYHFQTTATGELLRACYFDSGPTPVPDGRERFEHEVSFWLTWLREKANRQPI